MKSWYEELFTNYANTYDKEVFTQGTLAEVDFIETEIQADRSKTILDIGCGTGLTHPETFRSFFQLQHVRPLHQQSAVLVLLSLKRVV